jgi:UDPglucose--hexose-1-phosphate uridylyltransferase
MRHPHSQLASTTVVPLKIRTHLSEAQNYFDREGRCAYCDMLAYELEAGKRVIFENKAFVAFIPFAAGKAYEVWLIPKTHRASFGQIPEGDIPLFADALRVVTERYYLNLDKTAYNYVLRSAPYGFAESRSYHWYIRFVPHFKDVGAFELGSGIQVSAVSPENAAQVLARTTN